MIKIEAIKALIHTSNGTFGRLLPFSSGLNIVRADNTSGKSSLFGAILYGLGFEEILGGRNEKAMQSVFKSIVKELSDDGITERSNSVVQSEIFLQISNGYKTITTRRFIKNDSIKPQAIEVYSGAILTEPNQEVERLPMYVHDAGAASNEEIGFHKFLEEFIGTKLPEVINQEGKRVKLFLPLLAAAHFIEQKAGWSDFFANQPFYGIRDASAKVFEYILGFDVFETAVKRQETQDRVNALESKWNEIVNKISLAVKRGGGEMVGIPQAPQIFSQESKPYIRFLREGRSVLFSEVTAALSTELDEIITSINEPVGKNIEMIESRLHGLKEDTEKYELLHENTSSEISQERERLRMYLNQIQSIDQDLRKNKDAEKLQRIGHQLNITTSNRMCPTCGQPVNDNLLSEHLHLMPMRIDENIKYLLAQRKMVEAFITSLRGEILSKEQRMSSLESVLQENRARIRALKKTLISDDRLPSEEIIERKVIVQRELSLLYRLREEFETLVNELLAVGKAFSEERAKLGPQTNYLSAKDQQKFNYFENYFKSTLLKFGFTSKPINEVQISKERYLPMLEIPMPSGITKQIAIRIETSASDFIRVQWAYYIALMKTSLMYNGNHFNLLVFDEPQQQSASTENFKIFLEELSRFENEQMIVLASFQNSNEDYIEATKDLRAVNKIDFSEPRQLFIQRLEDHSEASIADE